MFMTLDKCENRAVNKFTHLSRPGFGSIHTKHISVFAVRLHQHICTQRLVTVISIMLLPSLHPPPNRHRNISDSLCASLLRVEIIQSVGGVTERRKEGLHFQSQQLSISPSSHLYPIPHLIHNNLSAFSPLSTHIIHTHTRKN